MSLPDFDELDNIVPFEELLSEDEKANLLKAQQKLPIMERNIEKAESIGIDMTEQRKSLAEMKQNIRKMLQQLGVE